MSSKSKVEEISKGEYDEPEVEERLEDLDTSRVPPDASAVMAIDDDSQRPHHLILRLMNHAPLTSLIKGY